MAKFDAKTFNPQAFGKYMTAIPNTKLNRLRQSGAVVPDARLADVFNGDQTGTSYAIIPYFGILSGEAQNYDGATNLSPATTDTYDQGVFTYGRMKGWTERDFSYDITGGTDFMANVRAQITDFFNNVDQSALLSILAGIFGMADAAGQKFVNSHTLDISTADTNVIGATTLNTVMQKACGDNKGAFSLVLMHSAVATGLENLNLLQHLKYTDENGIERDLDLGTWNGRLVIIDDGMPVTKVETTAGVYSVALAGTWAANDLISVAGYEHKVVSGSTSASAIASAIETAAAADTRYTITASSGTLTVTEKSGSYGIGAPVVTKTTTAGTATETTTTAAVAYETFTSYVLGNGAIGFNEIGAKVPYEMDRDAKTHGGEDTLIVRRRNAVSVAGISYKKAVQSTDSPTNAELANAANWELVNNGGGTKTYIDDKAIPIARIISRVSDTVPTAGAEVGD